MAEHLTHDALRGLPHGFFTRRGGVSTGAYASLNCSLRSADDPEAVASNRGRAAGELGFARPLALRQVHGAAVAVARDAWETAPEADAAVTDRPGVLLSVVTADCAPVLFADPEAGVVGAAHAGWRGAAAGVLEATVAAMAGLGAAPGRIVAVIGPCIAQASYEVAEDMVAALGPSGNDFLAPGPRPRRWQFDLPGYCAARLARCGVVAALGIDTLADEERFFSHRRRTLAGGGPIGHQLSAIGLAA
ncbi:MAG: peptidoglycan editing factor PgeF [Acetobacteraceae bacterium]|nr:peptidoglycan editing factor PgeF [Acetobacteraceae bacterium]